MKGNKKEKFLYEISSLLECGISLRDIPVFLSKDFSKEGEILSKKLGEGLNLKEVFKELNILSDEDIDLLAISEETGSITEAFISIYTSYKKEKELMNKLISFMIYPIFMLILLSFYGFFSLFALVPMMADLLRAMEIEEGLLFSLDKIRIFIIDYFHLIVPLAILFLGIFILISIKFSLHLRLVLGKKYFIYNETKIITSLEKLMGAGINVVEALFKVKNYKIISPEKIRDELEKGESLWLSFKKGGFSGDLSSIIKIKEESGDIVKAFKIYLEMSKKEMEVIMEKRIKLLEPITLLATGILMGMTILSIMGPLMEGLSKIK